MSYTLTEQDFAKAQDHVDKRDFNGDFQYQANRSNEDYSKVISKNVLGKLGEIGASNILRGGKIDFNIYSVKDKNWEEDTGDFTVGECRIHVKTMNMKDYDRYKDYSYVFQDRDKKLQTSNSDDLDLLCLTVLDGDKIKIIGTYRYFDIIPKYLREPKSQRYKSTKFAIYHRDFCFRYRNLTKSIMDGTIPNRQ